MSYALKILLREWLRYLPAVGAVTFSALLIAIQCGLLFGLLLYSSLPIDNAPAEIWVTTRDAKSLSLAHPIPETWLLRVAAQPEVTKAEIFLQGQGSWHKPNQGSSELCIILGTRLDDDALGAMEQLTPELRARLSEPGTVAVDGSELDKLGLKTGFDEFAEVSRQRVRVVGTVKGFSGVTAPYIFCSVETARMLIPMYEQRPDLIMYVLARCARPEDVPVVVRRLNAAYNKDEMMTYTKAEFRALTQDYWLWRSKAGTVMAVTAFLAGLVGAVITSQTLFAAALASLREYAVLDALGIPRWRLTGLVMTKSFWIGTAGLVISLPLIFLTQWAAARLRTTVELPPLLLLLTISSTMIIAVGSGAFSLLALRRAQPAELLR
jgi:putative ABC transport system permease protein